MIPISKGDAYLALRIYFGINHGLELAGFGFYAFKNSETSEIPRALCEGENIHKLSEIDRP